MKTTHQFTFTLCLSLLMPACFQRKVVKKVTIPQRVYPEPKPPTQKAPPITIWIHGTRFIRRPLFHSFFKSVPSLRLAKELAPDYYLRSIAKTLHKTAPNKFPLETFYLFGWSGKLNAMVREKTAKFLYKELERVAKEYKAKYQTDPIIRIITHSHGGTVALNLVKVKKDNDPTFAISELILLACPVQNSTQSYIENKLFHHTYSLYSSLDMVQILAPQVYYNVCRTKKGHLRSRLHWPPFSERKFREHPKVSQVKIKINGRALFHNEFTGRQFVSILPHILYVMNNWCVHPTDKTNMLCIYTQ